MNCLYGHNNHKLILKTKYKSLNNRIFDQLSTMIENIPFENCWDNNQIMKNPKLYPSYISNLVIEIYMSNDFQKNCKNTKLKLVWRKSFVLYCNKQILFEI